MKTNKTSTFLSILTIGILPFFLLLVGIYFYIIFTMLKTPDAPVPEAMIPFLKGLAITMFACVIAIWVLIIYYIYHVSKNPNVVGSSRLLWICLIFGFNVFSIPVYWYLHVYNQPDEDDDELVMEDGY